MFPLVLIFADSLSASALDLCHYAVRQQETQHQVQEKCQQGKYRFIQGARGARNRMAIL